MNKIISTGLKLTALLAIMSGIGVSFNNSLSAGPAYTSSSTATQNNNFKYVGKTDNSTKGFREVSYLSDNNSNTWAIANSVNNNVSKDNFVAKVFYNSNIGPDNDGSYGVNIFENSSTLADNANVSIQFINNTHVAIISLENSKVYMQILWMSGNTIEHTNRTDITSNVPFDQMKSNANNIKFISAISNNSCIFSFVSNTSVTFLYVNNFPFQGDIVVDANTTTETVDVDSKITNFTKIKNLENNIGIQFVLSTNKKIFIMNLKNLEATPDLNKVNEFDGSILSNVQISNLGLTFVYKDISAQPKLSESNIKYVDNKYSSTIDEVKGISIDSSVMAFNNLENDSVLDGHGNVYFAGNFTKGATTSNQLYQWLNMEHINFNEKQLSNVTKGLPADVTNPIIEISDLKWNADSFSVLVNYGGTKHLPENYTGLFSVSTPDAKNNPNIGAIIGVFAVLFGGVLLGFGIYFGVKYRKGTLNFKKGNDESSLKSDVKVENQNANDDLKADSTIKVSANNKKPVTTKKVSKKK